MDIKDYQEQIKAFAIYPEAGTGRHEEFVYLLLGLVNEAGEAAGKYKKLIRDGNMDMNDFRKELGDVLFYLTMLCSASERTVEDIAKQNYDKLADRLARGVIGGSGDNR